MAFRLGGNSWGIHRVIAPRGSLPQGADKLDASLPLFDNELSIAVSHLQIDAASFHQLRADVGAHVGAPLPDRIAQIISERGKMHNPVTGSGGVCLGKIAEIGPKHPLASTLKPGDPVVSLVSLTLTPLRLEKILKVDESQDRLEVKGTAIIFSSGMVAKIPEDLPLGVTLAALDVCGAPAQAKRLVKSGMKVLVIGLGKAGRAITVQAAKSGGLVYGLDASEEAVAWCSKNVEGHFAQVDSRDPVAVHAWVHKQTRGALADVVLHATSVPNTEMAGVLSARQGGTVLFFGMATNFSRVVLGAEGVGQDVNLLMGNGFVPGHADLMLDLVRGHAGLKNWFNERFA